MLEYIFFYYFVRIIIINCNYTQCYITNNKHYSLLCSLDNRKNVAQFMHTIRFT
jgi:predicted RNA-binding protein associated with RNAse of E/G family